jgi:hypothetical protein
VWVASRMRCLPRDTVQASEEARVQTSYLTFLLQRHRIQFSICFPSFSHD